MISSWLGSLVPSFARRQPGARTTRRPDRRYRLALEALEERSNPAPILWTGAVSEDATLAGNWQGGVVPGLNDEAIFNDQAQRSAVIGQFRQLRVGKLTAANDFTQFLTVQGGGILDVSMGPGLLGDSTWASPNALTVTGPSTFRVLGAGRTMVFSSGGVTAITGAGQQPVGNIYVRSGATVRLTGATNQFSGNLQVGDGASAGTVEVGGLDGGILNSGGGNITVTSTGTFKMTQTGAILESQGSFSQGGPAIGTFTNQGTFVRDGELVGPYAPFLDYVLTNTGTVRVTANSDLEFLRKDANGYSLINQSPGVVELHYGVHITGRDNTYKYKQDGGVFETHGEPTSGAGSVFFTMTSDFLGGSLFVNKNRGFGTLDFDAHDVKFANSLVVYIEVDGSSPLGFEMADQINLGGGATLTIDNSGANKPSLVITTLNAEPPAGWEFDIITAPNLVNTFDPANITFDGPFAPPGGYEVTYPFGPPRKVHIRVPT